MTYVYAEQAKAAQKENKRQESLQNPFDTRSELSRDARYIVKHLWIISVGIPVVVGIALALILAK